nr:Os03g0391300 [Ipomoea batatas]
MNIYHEPPGFLSSAVVCIIIRFLRGFIFVSFLGFPITQAEETQVVLGVSHDPFGFQSLYYISIHHLHCPPLPIQNRLHRTALRIPLRPHRNHHVHREPFPRLDLTHDLQRQFFGYEPRLGSLLRRIWEPESCPAVYGPENLNVPCFVVIREVEEHIPSCRPFQARVDIVPWLPGSAFVNGGAFEVGLMKILMVGGVQGPKQRVKWRVISPIAKINPSNKANNPSPLCIPIRHFAINHNNLLVVSKHGSNLYVLDNAPPIVRQLPQSGVPARFLPPGIPHQRDLSVHRPPRYVNQMLGVSNGVEYILPTPMRLVESAPGQGNSGNELIRNMSVLIQSDFATSSLRKKGVGNAGKPRGFHSTAPNNVSSRHQRTGVSHGS